MVLNSSTSLEFLVDSGTAVEFVASASNDDGSAITPVPSNGASNGATAVTVVAAPSGGEYRKVHSATFRNADTATRTVTVRLNDSGTYRELRVVSLGVGESLGFAGSLWRVYDTNGREKHQATETIGIGGTAFEIYKIGTAAEAIGQFYAYAKDSGFPGAYVLGAPGVNGWWTDASQATNAANPAGATQIGCAQLPNAASGSYYMLPPVIASSTGHLFEVYDLLWYNTGITVTTTTAQAITMPGTSIPSRDLNGSSNGEGWNAGILVTGATTNAGAITNTTLSYTNESGTAGRTATISSFPATAVIGTFVPFQLQAGDRGIRSIQSITLGTSYGGGSISVVMYRKLYSMPNTIANMGGIGQAYTTDPTGIRIYNGTALFWVHRASATTATTFAGSYRIIER